MTKPKKPRNKKYVPRSRNVFSAFNLLEQKHLEVVQAEPLGGEDLTDLAVGYIAALDAMLTGRGDMLNWTTVTVSLNVTMVLCENGFGGEYIAFVRDALDGAFRTKLRANRTGKWGFDGPAIVAIKQAFEVHDAQLEIATRAELMAALTEVHRRSAAGDVYSEAA